MKKLALFSALGLMFSGSVQAAPAQPLSFSAGLNTGYSLTGMSSVDGNTDWFVFDSDGKSPAEFSFYFDRTSSGPDLYASLYRGDTTGFNYAARGAQWDYSYYPGAHAINTSLTLHGAYDDTHDNLLGGEGGDPHFRLPLVAGRYSLAVTSINGWGGTYQFTTNISSVVSPVPEPANYAMMIAGIGVIGFMVNRKSRQKGTAVASSSFSAA
jgi:hypothetical protein